jgi:hypothetical protein
VLPQRLHTNESPLPTGKERVVFIVLDCNAFFRAA